MQVPRNLPPLHLQHVPALLLLFVPGLILLPWDQVGVSRIKGLVHEGVQDAQGEKGEGHDRGTFPPGPDQRAYP